MAVKELYDSKKETTALVEKALKGKGFVMFVGVATDEKDKDGNSILDFHYTRHHFGFEDLPKAINAFREHCKNDAMSIMGGK
jgi:hypothetical protein